MKASMAGLKMARPEIKGESDSESDEDEAPAEGMGRKRCTRRRTPPAALHAGLGGYDPLKPLGRGEEMPRWRRTRSTTRMPTGAATGAFSAPRTGDRRRKDKKAAGKDKKASKAKKEEKGGDEKKAKKEKRAEKPAKEKAAKAEKPAKEKKKAKGEKKLSSKMAAVSVER